jgi:hypothetical protein
VKPRGLTLPGQLHCTHHMFLVLALLLLLLGQAQATDTPVTLMHYGFEILASAAAVAAAGLNAINSNWKETARGAQLERKLQGLWDDWQGDLQVAKAAHGIALWDSSTTEGQLDCALLRDGLLELHEEVQRAPESSPARLAVESGIVSWDKEEGGLLIGPARNLVDEMEAVWWKGDAIPHREQTENPLGGPTRIMFLNLRHFKAGLAGGLLRDGIWDFARQQDLDWVGLSDHWLVVPPQSQGKWDRSGVCTSKFQRYRSSGIQAAAAKRGDTGGWGGKDMQWTIAQGISGTAGPVGGTLLAVRSGWSRADQQIIDRRGWGRYAGKKIVGVDGRAVIIIQVQGPCKNSPGPSTQWQQQKSRMKKLKDAGEKMDADPGAQLLADLYGVLESHVCYMSAKATRL